MKHEAFKVMVQGEIDCLLDAVPIDSKDHGTMMAICTHDAAVYVTRQQAMGFFGLVPAPEVPVVPEVVYEWKRLPNSDWEECTEDCYKQTLAGYTNGLAARKRKPTLTGTICDCTNTEVGDHVAFNWNTDVAASVLHHAVACGLILGMEYVVTQVHWCASSSTIEVEGFEHQPFNSIVFQHV